MSSLNCSIRRDFLRRNVHRIHHDLWVWVCLYDDINSKTKFTLNGFSRTGTSVLGTWTLSVVPLEMGSKFTSASRGLPATSRLSCLTRTVIF